MSYGNSWATPHYRTASGNQRQGFVNVAAQLFAPRRQEIYITEHRIFSSRSSHLNVIGKRQY